MIQSFDQSGQFKVKVSDFGFSLGSYEDTVNEDTVGSPLFMSPEVLVGLAYSCKCDTWSLGIMAFKLATG